MELETCRWCRDRAVVKVGRIDGAYAVYSCFAHQHQADAEAAPNVGDAPFTTWINMTTGFEKKEPSV